MSIIWATRGRTWGFRFLRDGGHARPLEFYTRAFSQADDELEVFHQSTDSIAIRFADPQDRKDRSGRIIPHEFVLTGDDMKGISCLDDATSKIWPAFSATYNEIWDKNL